ncbi:MAG TPA: hypothetical protein VI076_10190, partial [Actinopolymorphaceae bacterium]
MSTTSSRAARWSRAAAALLACVGLIGAAPSPRPTSSAPQPVTGEVTADGAPLLSAATGRYRDTVPGSDVVKHYQVRRTIPGSTVYIGVSGRRDPDADEAQLDVRLETLDGHSCDSDDTWEESGQPRWMLTTGLSTWATDAEARRRCQEADLLVLRIDQYTDDDDFAGTPMDITVNEEPPLARSRSTPAAAPTTPPPWSTMATARLQQNRSGATTPADAPTVTPGLYRSSIAPGELLFYRVEVGWGRRLQAHLRVRPHRGTLAEQLDDDQSIGVQLITPSGADGGASASGQSATSLDPEATVTAYEWTWPVVYRARESQEWDARAASVAGGYLVAVTLADDEEGERYRVPFELQIGLQGTASGQEPTYADGRRPIGPAWPARPSAHEVEGDRVAPERGTA